MINFVLILRHDEIEGKIVSPNYSDKKKEDSHFVPFSMKEVVIDLRGILLHDRSLHDEYLVLF